MAEEQERSQSAAFARALMLITAAIDVLDAHAAPADVAAHLDLGRERLKQHMRKFGTDSEEANHASAD